MILSYFLGANTKDGFGSLYAMFPPQGAFLHIIKGGPGTGKSSFMKRIASEAEARGELVHTVRCSGDPDSLDGVYLPEHGLAWVDGTAPHVVEPGIFGVDSDYLNLRQFFRGEFTAEEKEKRVRVNKRYKAKYQEAYTLLHSCAEHGGCAVRDFDEVDAAERIRSMGRRVGGQNRLSQRLIRAISCQGLIREEYGFPVSERIKTTPDSLLKCAEQALAQGWSPVLCPSPLDLNQWEALLLPEAGLVMTAIPQLEGAAALAMDTAIEKLQEAKALHDELERIYRPHMDFDALSAFTEAQIQCIFQ